MTIYLPSHSALLAETGQQQIDLEIDYCTRELTIISPLRNIPSYSMDGVEVEGFEASACEYVYIFRNPRVFCSHDNGIHYTYIQ